MHVSAYKGTGQKLLPIRECGLSHLVEGYIENICPIGVGGGIK